MEESNESELNDEPKCSIEEKVEEVEEEEEEEDDQGQPLKWSNFIPTTTQFLPFHLQMLRALYVDSGSEKEKKESGTKEDGKVEESIWEMMKNYLKERYTLRRMRHQSNYFHCVHMASIDYMKQDRIKKAKLEVEARRAAAITMANSRGTHHATPLSMLSSQNSPYRNRYSMSQFIFETDLLPRPEPFRVVKSLLQRKFRIANASLQRQAKPFQPLLLEAQRRIKRLQQVVRQQEQAIMARDEDIAQQLLSPAVEEPFKDSKKEAKSADDGASSNVTVDTSEESRARIETKLRLWRTLRSDLKASA